MKFRSEMNLYKHAHGWASGIGRERGDAGKKKNLSIYLYIYMYNLKGVQYEFEQAPGVGDGQGSPACFSSWGPKDSDMTELLN